MDSYSVSGDQGDWSGYCGGNDKILLFGTIKVKSIFARFQFDENYITHLVQ